jgi:6-phosphofructokinase
MMGNHSGRHALHCGVAARAHLIVLPGAALPAAVLSEVAAALAHAEYALVVVAEGYALTERRAGQGMVAASEFLRLQLEQAGLADTPHKRVIAEPFSRYLRGVRPAFAEVSAAYLKASLLMDAFDAGHTAIMPYVLAAHDAGLRPLDQVHPHHGVEAAYLPLLERLGLPAYRQFVRDHLVASGG